jgi:hypothetical protein
VSRVTPIRRTPRRAGHAEPGRRDGRPRRREPAPARRPTGPAASARAPRSQPRRGLPVGTARRIAGRIFSGWFAGKVLALALLGAGVWALREGAAAPQLRIHEITVTGNALVPTEEVLAALPVEGENLFFIKRARLERQLRALPAIEQARLDLHLPNSIRVTVHERTPAVVWDTGTRQLLADADGLVLRDVADSARVVEGLPVVRAPNSPDVDPGGKLDPDAVHVARALFPRLDHLGLGGSWLEYRPIAGVTIVDPTAVRVAIGFGEQLDAKLTAYLAIRRQLDQAHAAAELVDLRFLDRPYYRLRS